MNNPPNIVFFIDRCLGNRQIVTVLRGSGLSVECHDEHFPPGALDVDWLPEVGNKGWVVLTKDANISKNQLERIAVAHAGVKMFILASQNLSGAEMAAIFQKSASAMQGFANQHPKPFIAKIYRDGKIAMWKNHENLLGEISSS